MEATLPVVNHTTVGRIPNGAIVEKSPPRFRWGRSSACSCRRPISQPHLLLRLPLTSSLRACACRQLRCRIGSGSRGISKANRGVCCPSGATDGRTRQSRKDCSQRAYRHHHLRQGRSHLPGGYHAWRSLGSDSDPAGSLAARTIQQRNDGGCASSGRGGEAGSGTERHA